MTPIRRDVLAMGAAATVMAATSAVTAQAASPAGVKTAFFEKNGVRIRYQEVGSGFPFLIIPGGGLNSRLEVWGTTAVINCMEEFKNDFRLISMDLRNAIGGESTGPVAVDDPWGAFADDQLALLDHLGVQKFHYFGNCIGGPFGMKLMERAPDRVASAILSQPVGHRPEKPDFMYNSSMTWANDFRKKRPDVTMETIEKYFHNLYRVQPDFVYSVSRDKARTLKTPVLVLPDDVDAHPLQTSIDIASLVPNAETVVYPWKDPPELKARTISRARAFLKTHTPAR